MHAELSKALQHIKSGFACELTRSCHNVEMILWSAVSTQQEPFMVDMLRISESPHIPPTPIMQHQLMHIAQQNLDDPKTQDMQGRLSRQACGDQREQAT